MTGARRLGPVESAARCLLPPGFRPDGVIFDLDGTLWDSTATVTQAWNRVLERLGDPRPPLSVADIAGVMGMAHLDICRTLFPGLAEARREEVVLACYVEEEQAIHAQGGVLYAGVEAGLSTLAAGLPLFIVSNCQRGYIESFLAWSGLARCFADVECHGNTGAPKDENLRRIARRNGLQHPIYIGDTEGDRRAAASAGMPFIHAAYGFGSLDDAATAATVTEFAVLPPALLAAL